MKINLDQRPILIALAGPNGAGKSTFYRAHLHQAGLRFLNADLLALEMGIGSLKAAELATAIRKRLIEARESFVFETVLSDPLGEKVDFLASAVERGYTILMCFIGISNANRSEERVAMRVTQGGHDVPTDKLIARYPRVMRNLKRACAKLPAVNIYDNDDLRHPFRLAAQFAGGKLVSRYEPTPLWLAPIIKSTHKDKLVARRRGQ